MTRLLLRDLTPGTLYKLQIRAVEGDSTSEWSRRFDLPTTSDTTAPDVPAWATPNDWVVDGDTFAATWQPLNFTLDQNKDFDHYELELSDTVKTVVLRMTNTAYVLTYEQNRIFFGSPKPVVTARVRSVDGVGNASAYSSLKTATNPAPAPVNSITTTALYDSIDVKWDGGTLPDDFKAYVLQVSLIGVSGFNTIYIGTDSAYTYPTIQFTTDHVFKVFVQDKFGSLSTAVTSGNVRPKSSFAVDTTAPNTPTSLAASITNNANGIGARASVTWNMASPPSDLAGYYVRFRKVGDTNYSTVPFTSDVLAGTIELQSAYQNYEFQIKAYDWSNNESPWSATVTAVSPGNAAPANVTGLTSTAGKDSIFYAWTPVGDLDIKNYEVTFSTSPTFASGNQTYLTGSSTNLTVGGLNTNTTYYARVRAVDTAGNTSASFSSTDTRTTGVFPTANSITLTATSQVLTSPSGGGATTPATTTVTGTPVGTTITTYDYSVDGAGFSTSVPAGVSRTGNVVTITGSTMTARTIAVRMSDGVISDTMTIAKNFDGAAGATGGTGGAGAAGADAYTVLLTNEAQTIAAGTTNANAGTFTTNVNAYKGSTAQTVTVGTITGGATGISAAVTNNGTTNPTITFTATTSLTQANGSFSIPVTVAGITFTQIWTWSLSFTGSQGSAGAPGTNGTSATGVDVGNDSIAIPTTAAGAATAAGTITIPFSGWIGSTRAAATVAVSGLPAGITLSSNTAATSSADGSVVLAYANGATIGAADTGNITLTITCNGQNFIRLFSWARAYAGAQGGTGTAGTSATSLDKTPDTFVIPTDASGNALAAGSVIAVLKGLVGSTASNVTINAAPSLPAGITATPAGSGGTSAQITFSWSSGANIGGAASSGTFVWPIVVNGITFNSTFGWARAQSGATGNTGPAGPASDSQVPGAGNTPDVLSGLSSLYIKWAATTTNVLGAAQADPVTYEVHLSTTTGFTPSAATKATEVSGLSAMVDHLPGTNTALSYGTTYFIKIVPRDRDGAGAASAQGSGTISKVASTDVTSIGADLIVPGTGFVNALVVASGGSLQSSNYSSLTAGWKISSTGIEMNDTGSKIKADAIITGNLGGPAGVNSVLTIASNTSLVLNGGHIKSNTYNGNLAGNTTAFFANATAGFYLGNDGLVIAQGTVKAEALSGGTFNAGTINIAAGGAITGGSWTLNSSGLTIPNGAIAATKILLQQGQNILPPVYSDFEAPTSFYTGGGLSQSGGGMIIGRNTTLSKFNTASLGTLWGTQTLQPVLYLGKSITDYNIPITGGQTYIISAYTWSTGSVPTNVQIGMKWSDGTNATVTTGVGQSSSVTNPAGGSPTASSRISGTVTAPANVTGGILYFVSSTLTASGGYNLDGVQVEAQSSGQYLPSPWTPGTSTIINGGQITTGSIISSASAMVTYNTAIRDDSGVTIGYGNPTTVADPIARPAFNINAEGNAEFSNLSIRGSAIIGDPSQTSGTANATITNVTQASGSAAISSSVVPSFYPDDLGKAISGTGIPAGATVATYVDSTHITISAAATTAKTGLVGDTVTIARTVKYNSSLTSGNYVQGLQGWTIRSDGYSEFRNMVADSLNGNVIRANSLRAEALTSGTIEGALSLSGSFETTASPVVVNANFSSGGTTVTDADAISSFAPTDVGVTVAGAGIPANTVVSSYVDVNTIVLSQATTSAGASTPITLYRGRSVRMSGANGIVLSDQYRNPIVTLPTDPAAPATFTGSLVATDLFVNDEFRMFGTNNSLGQGSALTLNSGSYVPAAGPRATFTWDYVQMTSGSNGASYSPNEDDFVNSPNGLFYDSVTKHYYYSFDFFGGQVGRAYGPGNLSPDGLLDFTIGINNALLNGPDDLAIGGMAANASNFYFLVKQNSTGVWRHQAITRTGMFRAGGPVASDRVMAHTWDQTTNGGHLGQPAITQYNGDTYVAKRNASNKLVLMKYTGTSLNVAPAFASPKDTIAGNIQSIQVGKFDMSSTNVYAVVTVSASGAYRQNYVYLVGSSSFGFTSYNFPMAYEDNPIGTAWVGTSTDDATGHFVTLGMNGRISSYTSVAAGSAATTVKSHMTWRNDGTNSIITVNGVNQGGSAALGIGPSSPITTYTLKRRSKITLSAPTPIPDVGGDSPNAVTFWMGLDSGTRYRYDELAKGATAQVISTIRSTDASGTALPMKTGVSSKIITASGTTIDGDGQIVSGTNPVRLLKGSGANTLTTGVWTKITLAVETQFAQNSRGNIGATSSAVQINVSGWYMVTAGIGFAGGATGRRFVAAEIVSDPNSAVAAASWNSVFEPGVPAFTGFRTSASSAVYLSAGQFVRLCAFQDSGANLATDPNYTFLRVALIP